MWLQQRAWGMLSGFGGLEAKVGRGCSFQEPDANETLMSQECLQSLHFLFQVSRGSRVPVTPISSLCSPVHSSLCRLHFRLQFSMPKAPWAFLLANHWLG